MCVENERTNRSGIIVEAGCALGGSAIVICSAKRPVRKLFLYDVFATIPPPSKDDGPEVHERYQTIRTGMAKGIGGDTYYGYVDNLYEKVKGAFSELGFPTEENKVHMVKGMIQDTLHLDQAVCLAHIDVDWYEPVKICLERIEPWLVVGGAIVIDDYNDWSGCRKAVDEYFSTKDSAMYEFKSPAGALIITKLRLAS